MASIVRNTRVTDTSYYDDAVDWIGEAIIKLKTRYSYSLEHKQLQLDFCLAKIPCAAEAIAAVVFEGHRIMPSASDGPLMPRPKRGSDTSMDNSFTSVLCMPKGIEALGETSVNNWPEYVQSSALVESCPQHPQIRYRINFNKIELPVEYGCIDLWYWSLPKDETGFLMIPDNENYKTAIYWYVRMMMIGSGYPDPVFSYDAAEYRFEKYLNIAINEINYPTPDEVEERMIISNRMVNNGTGWSNFFTEAPEGPFREI